MRHRFIALVTSSALVISSLVLGTFAAQADDETSTVVAQVDEASTPPAEPVEARVEVVEPEAATTPEETEVAVEDDSTQADSPTAAPEEPGTPTAEPDATNTSAVPDATNTSAEPEQSGTPSATPTPTPTGATSSTPVTQLDAPITPVVQDENVTATISGQITPSDAYIDGFVCEVEGDPGNQWTDGCSYFSPDDQGKYSVDVTPGTTVVVYASAAGYVTTYLGGYLSSGSVDLSDPTVRQIPIPAAGGSVAVDTITLTKTTSISGTITLPPGYAWTNDDFNNYYFVTAYEVVTSNGSAQLSYANSSTIDSNAKYTIGGLVPNHKYAIVVDPRSLTITPSNDFIPTALGGYSSNDYPSYWDLSDSTITQVTATPAGVSGQNITMKTGAVIQGSISPANADYAYVYVCLVKSDSDSQWLSNCLNPSIGSDGSYSQPVTPGSTVAVYGVADGYLYTYTSGVASSISPYYIDSSVPTIATPADGGIVAADITLAPASSISGTVLVPDGYTLSEALVRAYPIDTSSGTPQLGNSSDMWFEPAYGEETYTIDRLIPGTQYLVVSDYSYLTVDPSNDFVTTAHGGYASSSYVYNWDLTAPAITNGLISLTTTPATGVDITMVPADVVSGTITPSTAQNISVQVCELTADKQSVNTCDPATVDSNGDYSANVTPGATVVVQASADGYLYTWYDGYVTTDSYAYNLSDQMTQIQAPATGKDIELQKAGSISGTIKLPSGYAWTSNDFDNYYFVTAYEVVTSDGSTSLDWTDSTFIDAQGNYAFTNLLPNHEYVIVADPSGLTITPSNDFITTVYGGYSSNDSSDNWDLSDSGIVQVSADPAGTTGADITLATGAIIKGKVTPADAPNEQVYVCYVQGDSDYQWLSNCQNPAIASDGSYSQPVNAGAKVAVYAVADGYFYTYPSGLTSSNNPYSLDSSITPITAPAIGSSVTVDTITLSKASSISGKVILPSGYDLNYAYVRAYQIDTSSGTPQISVSSYTSADTSNNNTYTIDKLVPGKQYLVAVDYDDLGVYSPQSNDFVTTAYGQHAAMSYASSWDLTQSDIANNLVTLTNDPATGKDITMVKADIVSGTITPATAQNKYAFACEVVGTAPNQSTGNCTQATVDDNGAYSVKVTPGVKVVVRASADGYLSTYVGGYVSSNTYTSGLSDGMTVIQAPATGQNIDLQQAGSISGKVTLPNGYRFTDGSSYFAIQAYEVMPDGSLAYSIPQPVAQDGTYSITNLMPGHQYIVSVGASSLSVSPSNTDLVSTALGGYASNGSPSSWDLSNPQIEVVTAVAGDIPNKDIAMTLGSIIRGTITPDPASLSGEQVSVCEILTTSTGYRSVGNCTYPSIGADGSYSSAVAPGATAVVYAVADGYFYTWFGGYTGSNYYTYDLDDPTLTPIPTLATGGVYTGNDIDLVKASSISGTVIFPSGYSAQYGWATAYVVDTSNSTPQFQYVADGYFDNSTGNTYTIDKLVPGEQYLVVVSYGNLSGVTPSNDFLNTAHGGYASLNSPYNWDPTQADIAGDLVTLTATPATGVDIEMSKGALVTGTITPQGAQNIQVRVCMVQVDGTYQYMTNCRPATMNGNVYSAYVDPGSNVVVQAKADDYLYTWLGTYVDTNDTSYGSIQDGMAQAQAPASGQNIELRKAAIISGTLHLPDGYSLTSGYAYASEVVQNADGVSVGNSVQGAIAADGTYRIAVKPDTTYIVWASPYDQSFSQGNVSDLLMAIHGGYLTEASYLYSGIDFTDPAIVPVTTTADQPGVDLTMVVGAKITGTVYAPDGTPLNGANVPAYVSCTSVDGYINSNYMSTGSSVASDGSYSCTVVPGKDYVARAVVNGPAVDYPTVWVGGFIGSNPTLPDDSVTQITAPQDGQDIYLTEGSSISGKLIGYVPDPDNPYVYVQACVLYADGTTNDCQYTSTIADDGSYSITGLVPDANTIVYAYANGYMQTYYGGYAGSSPVLPNDKVTEFTSAAVGGNVPGIDITLVKPVTITGKILPASVVSNAGGVYVYACPVFTENGQDYYRSAAPMMGGGSATLNTNTGSSVDQWCTIDWFSASDDTYSLQVAPGVDYVILAQADGYADAWYGGYLGDSGLILNIQFADDAPDRLLPSSNLVQLVSGTPGQLIENKDITFGESSVTVTFDADGGTPATATKSTVSGGTVYFPVTPTRTGYTFGGWFTAKDGVGTQFLETTPVTTCFTVYAKWTAIPTYQVTFVDGQGNTLATRTVYEGKAAAAPADPTRDGFTFGGWDVSFDNVTSDLTVTAIWIAQAVTVTYDSQGGSSVDPAVVENGGTVVLPTPTKEHFVFAGWFTAADGGTQVTSPLTVTADMTLYAQWTPAATYTLKYDANGGSGSMDSATYYAQDVATVADNGFTRIGYTFVSWNTAADNSGTTYAAGSPLAMMSDVTLYAQWQLGPVTVYTVTFVDGQGTTLSVVSVPSGTAATAPANPTRYGYVFAGWDVSFANVTSNITVTALWTPAQRYTLSYDANGGTGSMAAQSYYGGDSVRVAANAFTREGYIFTGWNTAADGHGQAYPAGSNLTITGNVTLYAQWRVPGVFTVTFTDGQGKVLATVPVVEGGAATAPADPVRAGYTFSGWDTAFTNVTSNLTVNAVWKAITPEKKPPFPTGGTVHNNGPLLLLALGFVTAGVLIQRHYRSAKR